MTVLLISILLFSFLNLLTINDNLSLSRLAVVLHEAFHPRRHLTIFDLDIFFTFEIVAFFGRARSASILSSTECSGLVLLRAECRSECLDSMTWWM